VHIHRIGRTGRAGEEGLALNLASMNEMARVGQVELVQGAATKWHKLTELDKGSDKPLIATMVTLQILGGRKEKIRPGDVLGALTKDMGFAGDQIGKINVTDMSTYVAVDRAIADKALSKLNSGLVKGKRVRARRVDMDTAAD
jgi:ATP-independent RNA helicase DbpA